MDRRTFFKTVAVAGGVTLLAASESRALQFYPHMGKQKWAVLYGSRYGATRDAGVWISEGMGGIANVFDAREEPDLSQFDGIIVGSGIYVGKIDTPLEAYLMKNASRFSSHIRGLYIVCGGGDTPRAQEYVTALAKACGAKPEMTKVFPGRLTIRLLTPQDAKVEEEVAKKRNVPYQDSDSLQRKVCLDFGAAILAGG